MTKFAETRQKTIDRRALRRLVIEDCFKNLRFFEEMRQAATAEADEEFERAKQAAWEASGDSYEECRDDINDGCQVDWEEAWYAFWLRIGFAGVEQADLETSHCGLQRALATAADNLIDQMMAGRSSGCLGQVEQASLVGATNRQRG